MVEEGNSSSPRIRRDSVRVRGSDPEFDSPLPGRMDRKSLAGMSESVKAILAPLLGGKKSHSTVEVDMGRESGSAYETVDTGSTAMQRYSTVEADAAVEAPSPPSNATQEGTGTGTITTPRWSTSRKSDVSGRLEIKGKSEEPVNTSARTSSPVDPAYARVDTFLSATKPKMKEYDDYITETAPKLRVRVDSILADNSHEAGFERKLPGGGLELPKLVPPENPSILNRVKDTVTGQVPGYGIYSGKATIDETNQLDPSLRQAGTGIGRLDRETAREPGEEGSGGSGSIPNENLESVRDTLAAREEKSSPERGGRLRSVNNPHAAVPIRRMTIP